MITIDGVEYAEDQLTDEQKYMVAQLQDLEQKITQLRFQMDQLAIGREAFVNRLAASLEAPVEAEE